MQPILLSLPTICKQTIFCASSTIDIVFVQVAQILRRHFLTNYPLQRIEEYIIIVAGIFNQQSAENFQIIV